MNPPLQFDVLVIGAGGAGLRAAVAAAATGARVAVLSKSLLGKAQTVMGAAMAAVMSDSGGDDWSQHFADTVRGARHVNHWRMAELLAREAPERVRELLAWGAVLDRNDAGGLKLGDGSGHGQARLVRAGQHRTGQEMLRTLQARLAALRVATFVEHVVVDLLVQDGAVAGACAVRRDRGTSVVFHAPAVVLATGGMGKAYEITSNFQDTTGDGQALALRAGADLIDMEFVQFHPTGMIKPDSARGLLVAESIRNVGGVMRNADGDRFLFRYIPAGYRDEIADTVEEADRWYQDPAANRRPPELLARDDLSRAIEAEIRAGRGTPDGGVYLDIASRRPADTIRRALPHMVDQFMELGRLDITREPMEVAPTCHYLMGGVRVDPDTGASTVPGLYAAGEAAGGLHGANRLNGNGISELLVFGHRAGAAAARHALACGPIAPSAPLADQAARIDHAARATLGQPHGEDPFELQSSLRRLMQRHAGVSRSESGLAAGLAELSDLQRRAARARAPGGAASNPAWQAVLDLRSMLAAADAVLRSARLRTETRGAHVREDHPDGDADLAALNTVVRHDSDGPRATLEPRAAMPDGLRIHVEALEASA